jgi:hypothetical protein
MSQVDAAFAVLWGSRNPPGLCSYLLVRLELSVIRCFDIG